MDVLNSPKDVVVGLAVDEAIDRLGYLNESARPFLISAVQDGSGVHPRALCTAHRKEGEQLTRDELKALGLRANAFMSRQARAEITDKGLAEPLQAHEKTLLRAFFTFARWRSFRNDAVNLKNMDIDVGALSWKYSMLPPVCARCRSLDGETTMPLDAHILPPDDCECETANYGIHLRIDWYYGLT
jgi:hypothetical protein